MSTVFVSPNWRMPRNASQSKSSNYSLNFDGSSRIEIPSSTSFIYGNNDFSFSAWIYKTGTSNKAIFSKGGSGNGNHFLLFFSSNNTLRTDFYNSSSTGDFSYSFSNNQWYHIVVTRTGSGNVTLYVNGGSGQTITPTYANGNISNSTSFIGSYYASSSFNWLGQITEVAIFDYALSASQVATLWGGGTEVSNPMALPSPPIAYYPLGDSAWNGQYLAENNAIGDYVFDFSSDLIDSNFSLTTGQTQFSASIWVKFTGSLGNDESLIANESGYSADGFAIFKNASNTIEFRCESQSAVGTTTIALNKWYLATATYNAGTMVLYVNGQQEATQTTATSITQPSIPKTRLGKYITGNIIPFTGELSNAQIFNTALTATEAETLYNYGSPIKTLANIPQNSNLKAWYKLDASDVYDNSTTEWNNIEARANNKGSMLCGYNAWSGNALLQSYNSPVERSISIWVRRTASMGYHGCCNQQGTGGAQAYSTFFVWSNRGYIFSFFVPSPNKFVDFGYMAPETWYHAVLTDTGVTAAGRFKTYWNGEFANASTDLTYDLGTPANGFKWAGGNFLFAGGSIADGRIFDTVLSASDVQTLYNNGAPSTLNNVKPSNLKQWLTFENIDTSVGGGLYDKSGNNNQVTTPLYPWVAAQAAENLNVPISTLNGLSSGMNQSNLVQSDLQTVAPYSKYAMSFDGTDSATVGSLFGQVQDVFSVSTWVNFTSNPGYQMILSDNIWFANYTANNIGLDIKNSSGNYYDNNGGLSQGTNFVIPSDLRTNKWINVAFSYAGSSSGTTAVIKMYLNGVEMVDTTVTYSSGNANLQNASNVYLGSRNGSYQFLNGSLSNLSIWNYALTASQVREIYNQGLPSDLNNFSGTAPVAWWQLGENSSYVGGWTFADEIASNNGTSGNLPETALTNGVGTTANGTSSGMGVGALVGDAPYSTANAISSGMAVTAKGTNVP